MDSSFSLSPVFHLCSLFLLCSWKQHSFPLGICAFPTLTTASHSGPLPYGDPRQRPRTCDPICLSLVFPEGRVLHAVIYLGRGLGEWGEERRKISESSVWRLSGRNIFPLALISRLSRSACWGKSCRHFPGFRIVHWEARGSPSWGEAHVQPKESWLRSVDLALSRSAE